MTGKSTDEAARALAEVSGRDEVTVTAVSSDDLLRAARRFGIEPVEWLNFEDDDQQLLLHELSGDWLAPSTYAVGVQFEDTNHLLVVQMQSDWETVLVSDNKSDGAVRLRGYPHNGVPVLYVWRCARLDEGLAGIDL